VAGEGAAPTVADLDCRTTHGPPAGETSCSVAPFGSTDGNTGAMLIGAHTILYSADAGATRDFLRDVLDLPSVDAGDGWLIFALPPGEVAVHPHDDPGRHELYLMCDDIDATVAELQAKGAQVSGPISERGWGRLTSLRIPGGVDVGLYQPLHPTAIPPRP